MASLLWFAHFLSFLLFHLRFQAGSSLPFSFNSSSAAMPCQHDQSLALVQFMKTFSIRSNASSWDFLYPKPYPKTESWKEGTDCCLWDGVTCEIETGNVIGLNLSSSLLYGTIHSNNSLFLLPHLQKLDLSNNDFNQSQIVPQFGQFLNLRYLNLNHSVFEGQIPLEISYLPALVSLDLSKNPYLILETFIFNELVQNLTQLQQLDLSEINMSLVGSSSLMNLSSSLTSLKLSECQLQGKFPDISHLSKLVLLDLSYNNFSGEIPSSLENFKQLDTLYLDNNNLNGQIPSLLGSLKELSSLDLSYNNFNGEIPSSFENLKQLDSLYLYKNNLSGQIPSLLGSLKELSSLDLSYNNFNGEIPSSFENLTQLYYLDLSCNNFNGEIPSSFENLKQLYYLDLEDNNLNGQIPSSLGRLKKLSSLYLSYNNFNGEIPSSFENLKQLHSLYLYKNNLSGQIPVRT
ncbi:receptor-like protein 9DC1 [Hevea brasiliensis]|uniref:receptor-like protein 9DC1 n=1 Tax=Hevea brasiliensis TaxID=3981 RepID=UPI0025D8F875|nr:receptor-like protein 9DC1 [Hevea brasiliensis]